MRVTSPGYLKLRLLYTSTKGERRETVGVSGEAKGGGAISHHTMYPEVKVLTEAIYLFSIP